jgi:hypothetical protein
MRSKIYKPKKKKTFKQAVEATPMVKDCYRPGKQAILNKEQDKVELTIPRNCGGSLFIDKCLVDQKIDTDKNRWDYAIDYNGEVFFFEVHSAKTGEVSKVLKKLQWLKHWLHTSAPEINALKAETPYYWVKSKSYSILPYSSEERAFQEKGLRPISKLILK